ncbi:MAG: DUF819 family protein [Pseudomonadota bacterium]
MIGLLIPASDTLSLLAAFGALAVCAEALVRLRGLESLSTPVILILLGALVSNAGLLPTEAPFITAIWTLGVPLAVALLLLQTDLRAILSSGQTLAVAFALAVGTVLIGIATASASIDLGPDRAALAGIFTATYIGGSVNFAAVSVATGMQGEAILGAAVAVDNLLGAMLIVALNVGARLRLFEAGAREDGSIDVQNGGTPRIEGRAPLVQSNAAGTTVTDLLVPLALAAVCCALGQAISAWLQLPQLSLLFVSIAALAVAAFGQRTALRLPAATAVSQVLLAFFFIAIGLSVDVTALASAGPLLGYVSIMLGVHLLLLMIAGAVFRLPYATLALGSAAAVMGPALVAGMAAAHGWRRYTAAGIALGVLGYGLGTFAGLAVYAALGGQL